MNGRSAISALSEVDKTSKGYLLSHIIISVPSVGGSDNDVTKGVEPHGLSTGSETGHHEYGGDTTVSESESDLSRAMIWSRR